VLYRARIAFVMAVVLGAIVLFVEFPIGQLVQARGAVASSSAQLSRLQSENRTLANQVRELQEGSTIEQVAHEEYGLVEPGQRSIVVMPGAGAGAVGGRGPTGASAPLGSTTIPKSDLVPTDASLSPAGGGRVSGGGGFWGRVLDRLEFWKASV
jgi:cell division protein FtsB